MATAKTKKSNKKPATKKSSKPVRRTRTKKFNVASCAPNGAKRTILVVIGLTILMVILATFNAFFFTPERIAKDEVSALVNNYYEKSVYENIIKANESDINSGRKTLDDIMKKYSELGFSRITFRQLILLSEESFPHAAAKISPYCDENRSYAVIYPDAPYGKSDYHVEYNYDCKF